MPPKAPLPLIEQLDSEAAAQEFERDLKGFLKGRTLAVLADVLVHRFGCQSTLQGYLDRSGVPVATLSWGKSSSMRRPRTSRESTLVRRRTAIPAKPSRRPLPW